jgi:capsular polysaccharide biosynthesis protein
MELREYVAIIRRRWLIIAALTLFAFAVGAFFMFRGPRAYEASIRIAVSAGADARADAAPYAYYRDYYAWLSSEYLADDLSEIVKSDAFAEDVRRHLNEDLSGASIRQVLRTRKTHRILEITVQAPSEDQAQRLSTAVAEVIRVQGAKYLAQLATPASQIAVIDLPSVKPATTTGFVAADLGLRGALGLVAGLLVAFLAEYLDSRLRTRSEVERVLGLPVLGEIPSR